MQTSDTVRVAVQDKALSATLLEAKPLVYREGASAELDRPAHVRAASSLQLHGGTLVLVQDDANFIALVQPDNLEVDCIVLPAGHAQRRQFDDRRGNKRHKLDLEATVLIPPDRLLAFGSGSKSNRETIALLRLQQAASSVQLVPAPALYAALRAQEAFAGSELNIEGAVLAGDVIRFFNRGNGKTRNNVAPANATIDVAAEALLRHLDDPAHSPVPALHGLQRYELGSLGGRALTFTDATILGSAIVFTAVAELSPDATRDGPVSGSVIGVIEADAVRWTPVCAESGIIVPFKVEGIMLDAADPTSAIIVADPDEAERPAELARVRLSGNWPLV